MKKVKSVLSAFLATTTAASLLCNTASSSVTASQKGEEVAAYAETLVGISGRPNIITDYWNGLITEWCAMAVVYVCDKTGVGKSVPRSTFVDRSGEYFGFRDWFAEKNRFYYRGEIIPQPGDFIIFDQDYNNHGDHIGIVKYADVSNNLIYTVEGNVNDKMMNKTYTLSNSIILGYCRPDYNDSDYVETPPATTTTTALSNTTTSTTTTTVTSSLPSFTTIPTQQITPPAENNGTTSTISYYVSSSIGCNLRSKPDFEDSSIIEILDTNTVLYPVKTEGSFLYVKVAATGNYGYVHISTIAPSGQNTYTYGCKENYYVSSGYGCYLYTSPYNTDVSTAKILDFNQKLTLLSMGKEYSYVEVVMYNGNVYNGYIHNDVISPINYSLPTTNNNTTADSGIVLNGTTYSSCGCSPFMNTKYVVSDIGCNLRAQPVQDDSNVLYILDTYTPVNIIHAENDFYYCSVYVNQNLVYGYIHSSVLS